jgi:hypothetical protein
MDSHNFTLTPKNVKGIKIQGDISIPVIQKFKTIEKNVIKIISIINKLRIIFCNMENIDNREILI